LDVRPDQVITTVILDEAEADKNCKGASLEGAQQGAVTEQGLQIPGSARVAAFSPDHRLLALGGVSNR
jgi:hypothetical protein